MTISPGPFSGYTATQSVGPPGPQGPPGPPGIPGTIVPVMNNTPGGSGSSPAFAHEDHVHPSDTSRVNKSGDIMAGSLGFFNGTSTSPRISFSSAGFTDWMIDNFIGGLRVYNGAGTWLGIHPTGEMDIASNSASVSTTTGALRVTGGLGVGGDVRAGGGVYSAGVLLTCFGVQYAKYGTVDLAQWDAVSPTGKHDLAHQFVEMLGDFDPRDPGQYVARMLRDEALPGMPKPSEWKQSQLSLDEMNNRLWLAVELLASAFMGALKRIEALENR